MRVHLKQISRISHEGRAGDGQVGPGRAEGGAEGRAAAGEAPPVVARLRPLSATPQGHLARRDEVSHESWLDY